ncbi:MAG: linear amide C-N hydrolase [Oligoflexia bacterium]|nr:linear amide C-N hydrolase [Oligoflexia bacterium]
MKKKLLIILLIFITTQISTIVPLFPCTTFFISEKNEGGEGSGHALMGKSYDWHLDKGIVYVNKRGLNKHAVITGVGDPLLQTHSLLQQSPAMWTSRYGSITFNQFGREFPNGGMNEAGLAVEILLLEGSEMPHQVEHIEHTKSINELQWIQYQLDNFSSIKEMVESSKFLTIIPLHGEVHFFACDRSRACATFEYSNRHWVITSGEKLKVKSLSNSYYADSASSLPKYCGFGGKESIPTDFDSLSRFVRASSMASQFSTQDFTNTKGTGVAGTDGAIDYGFKILESVADSDDNQWQILYDLENKGVYFRTRSKGGDKIKFIDLKSFDLSCQQPVMAFDVQSIKGGDVTSYFKPFNRDDNLRLLHSVLHKMPAFNVPDATHTMANLPQTFICQ